MTGSGKDRVINVQLERSPLIGCAAEGFAAERWASAAPTHWTTGLAAKQWTTRGCYDQCATLFHGVGLGPAELCSMARTPLQCAARFQLAR